MLRRRRGDVAVTASPLLDVLPVIAAMLSILAVAFVLTACAGDEATTTSSAVSGAVPEVKQIGPDELAEMLKDKDFLLINTHVPYEGEIEQTDLFINYEQAAVMASELPEDKDAKIVVYCRSDRMSTIAADVWAEAGYTNLYNLTGGFVAWEEAGYELLMLPQ